MALKHKFTAEYVASVLHYDPKCGEFFWKKRPLEHFKSQRGCNNWNAKWPGKAAGTFHSLGYISIGLDGVSIFAHQLVFLLEDGEWPKKSVDHINRIRCDNRRKNLRLVEHWENMQNRNAKGPKIGC